MHQRHLDLWYRLGRLLAKIFIPTFGRIEVVGRENVPPYGPVIIAANHQSYADPPVIVYAIPRPVWFMAKRGLFRNPIAAFFLRSLHVYPVDRDRRDVDAVKWAQDALAIGRALLIFPQGTRSPGRLSEGNDGLTCLALRANVPILPVAITGTEHIKGMFRIAFHFQRLKVVIGEPFSLPSIEGRLGRSFLHSLTEEVMVRVAMLLPDEYRGPYALGASVPRKSARTIADGAISKAKDSRPGAPPLGS